MKNINYLLLFALFTIAIFFISTSLSFDAQTGDKKLDEHLNEINKDALADLNVFKKNFALQFNVDENEVSNLMTTMEPVEILLSYEISRLTSKPINEILAKYSENKEMGWKKVFLSLGIQQNTNQFKDICKIELVNPLEKHNSLTKK